MKGFSNDISSLLERMGFQPDEIERALNTHVAAPQARALYLHDGQDSALWATKVTVRTADELRRVLNPRDAEGQAAPPGSLPNAPEAAPGDSWSAKQHGRARRERGPALDALRATVYGERGHLQTLGELVGRCWLPARVTVAAASSLTVAAGQVVVLGNQDRTTPYSAVFDTVTIEPGGQIVFASPTSLTVNTFNRNAA